MRWSEQQYAEYLKRQNEGSPALPEKSPQKPRKGPSRSNVGSHAPQRAGFSCFVFGDPKTQGGTVPFRHPKTGATVQVTRGQKGLPAWRKTMTEAFAIAAKQQLTGPLDGPLAISYWFILPRRKSHPKTKHGERWPWRGLDEDKLTRALRDSLKKGGVIVDDSRICMIAANSGKRYASLHEMPGVQVHVRPIAWELMREIEKGE